MSAFRFQWLGEVHVGDQKGCARCGAAEHLHIAYQPFTNPIDVGEGFTATHYAPCPANGEPILFCQGPGFTEEAA